MKNEWILLPVFSFIGPGFCLHFLGTPLWMTTPDVCPSTTSIHIHASKSAKPERLPPSHEWFRRNADYWVGETVQNQGQEIRFCWTKKEELENRQLYNSIKHQLFMMTLVPSSTGYNYNGFYVNTQDEDLHCSQYIIFSNGDTEELWEEVDEYDKILETEKKLLPCGVYVDLNDLSTTTESWYGDSCLF